MAPQRNELKPEQYRRLTGILKSRLLAIKSAVNNIKDQEEEISRFQHKMLKSYTQEIDKKRTEYDEMFQRALYHLDDDALTEDVLATDQTELEDLFIFISTTIEFLQTSEELQPTVSEDNMASTSGMSTNMQPMVKLPKFELHKFNGDLSTWTTFINLFDSSIHFNNNLSNVTKFQYLLSVLTDEPLCLIHNLNLSDDNYLIAYKILRDRYQNDRRLQLMHLNNILDLPDISFNNVSGIRVFINSYNENTQALQAINCKMPDPNPLLIAIILRKMDFNLRKRLESSRNASPVSDHTLPSINEILNFLNRECMHHEDAAFSTKTGMKDVQNSVIHLKSKPQTLIPSKTMSKSFSHSMTSNEKSNTSNSCAACNDSNHKTYMCSIFRGKSPRERFQLVKGSHHCILCLGLHDLKACKSQSTCKVCHKRHNTLLHFNSNKIDYMSPLSNVQASKHSPSDCVHESNNADTSVMLSSQNQPKDVNKGRMVLLGTVLLKLCTCNGVSHTFRALIDSGSMCTLITEYAVNLLNTTRHRCNVQISGINQQMIRNKGQIFATLETLSGHQIISNHPMIILNKLTVDLPRVPVSPEIVQLTKQYNLADSTYHKPSRIDVILGAALIPYIFTGNQISLGPNLPHLINTPFGHVVMGTTPCIQELSPSSSSQCSSTLNVSLLSTNDSEIHDSIQRFWIQEEPPKCSLQTENDILCEKHFVDTHGRDDSGRYIVRLPFKPSAQTLGISRNAAEIRLRSMERKFASNDRFASLYHDFMNEYLTLGHMSKYEETSLPENHYFLPHHGVLKESSSTTKLRTVFDASCKTSSGFSLNDMLLTGQKLQNNIADILMQFRRHNVVLCCDIRQMYRQILVHPADRDFQLILWRPEHHQPVHTYRLNTVTYGMNSSPFLAIRTLHQLADDEGDEFPKAAHAIRNHTYVDDIITGANSLEEAVDLKNQLTALLERGCFELRKWVSNSSHLLNNLPDSHLESPTFLSNNPDPQFTVLGLQWSPVTDSFSFSFNLPETSIHTKRTVLQTIAKIYDPCGFLTPFIMLAKCIMQLIWTRGLTWDAPLPKDIQAQWFLLLQDTQNLSNVKIPRSLNLNSSHKVELHGFCDASESGYAAVVYFRFEQPNGTATVNLVLSKSRVAPLKRVTIPRLELCAAHLLAQLVAHCLSLFSDYISTKNVFLWSDSTVTLTWLRTPPYRLKTYVANRVSQTQELVPIEAWNHVSSVDNPADCASRGLLLSRVVDHSLWWYGPSWLSLPAQEWPKPEFNPIDLDSSHEIKPNPLPILHTSTQEDWPVLSHFSSWNKLQRVIAFVLRFIHNCRNPSCRVNSNLTPEELRHARLKIFYSVQQSVFCKEIKALANNDCPKHLSHLNPFLDHDGLVRVGGRLSRASLPQDVKHPVLLPKRHHIINIIIDHYHIHNLHAGPQLVQSLLAQEVWILNARNNIRLRIHKCITCFRSRPTNTNPLMADLPPVRVTPAKPFTSTGIDYGGPYTAKVVNLRSVKHIKVYLCLFICMVTKAVHLEIVTDLTSEAFIAAIQRFISRRGICKDLYSDCGTTFIGAHTILGKIIKTATQDAKNKIQQFSSNMSIDFHFNPPASPHHGGLWESAIKSAKHHLNRVMGNTVLTLSELMTLTARVEAMLNSRPLTPLSSDPSDLRALTPGHFLTGGPLVSLPEQDYRDIPTNRLKHWHLVQQMFQRIWDRWHLEYLHTLQQRVKWRTSTPNLNIGDLVLIQEHSSTLSWPLGRIVETFPGSDGTVRVVSVKTSNGIFKRPVTKIFPLPITDC